jgi:hypothetical protein
LPTDSIIKITAWPEDFTDPEIIEPILRLQAAVAGGD